LSKKTEDFLDHLNSKDLVYPPVSSNFEEFLFSQPGMDINIATKIKKTSISVMREWCEILSERNVYNYSKLQSLINEQLMHYLQYSMPNNNYALFNTGVKNMVYVLPIGYQNKGNDAGKSFLVAGYTDNKANITPLYGKLYVKIVNIKEKTYYFYVSNWRRLNAERANYLRDHYYAVLSTSLSTLMRNPRPNDIPEKIVDKKVRRVYAVRVLINLSCAQIVAERCADMKNILMHAFSEYSDVFDLITDKFAPPYKNHTEVWIVSRISRVKKLCEEYQSGDNVFLRQPVYVGNKRLVESLGGKFCLTSIWSDDIITETQDLLDDLYLYVHTPKEPSNIHHENIKAVNTIIKFQELFDEKTDKEKDGEFQNLNHLKSFLSQNVSVGFHKDILYSSVKHTIKKLNFKGCESQIASVRNESILEISSTKSCIPELERKVKKDKMVSETKSKIEKTMNEFKPNKFIPVEDDLRFVTDKGYIYEKNSTNRMKVHDTILELFEKVNGKDIPIASTLDVASWNIVYNSNRVVTDICIKAQYGAKREFYVVNLGAKAMVRIFENTYKILCKMSSNEMISVPGDKKLLHMQDKVNKMLLTKTKGKLIYSVNGDCTKWSAAETLQSFDVMSYALKDILTSNHVDFLRHICYCWANKLIYTPNSLIKNYKFKTKKTKFLEKELEGIHSTQNFLQGMMNYSSSFKAVCCSNYTIYLWKKMRPNSSIEVDHLEHSDDYLLLIRVSTKEELLEFRIFHRIMMKLHGFNDSIKKTNTQRLMTEFISLIAFNGQMTYPQIKKTKEVGMNTSCTGYKDDMDTALSRCAEAMRIGVDQITSYAMLRIHQLNILRSYSLLTNMHNNKWSINDMKNVPVELFGVPDILPSFYMLTNGNVNNYRLNKFSDVITCINMKKALSILFRLSFWQQEKADSWIDNDLKTDVRLYSPKYSYDQENKLIKKIRAKLKISFEEITEFLNNHKSYNFMKPKTSEYISLWMHSLYFKPTFSIAYSRMSRAQLTLRLSRLTRNKCITAPELNLNTPVTIKTYIEKILNIIENMQLDNWTQVDQRMFNRTILSNDPTAELLYSMLEDSSLSFQQEDLKVLTANLIPFKPSWINISNPVSSLYQFIFNPDDFVKDNRQYKGLTSLTKDKEAIEELYGMKLDSTVGNSVMNSIYKDLIMLTKPQSICMTYTANSLKFDDYVTMLFEHQTIAGTKFDMILRGTTEARNPYTSELYFRKQHIFTKDQIRLCIDDMLVIYGFLKHTCNLEQSTIKQYFRNLEYYDRINDISHPCLKVLSSYSFNNFVNTDPKSYELKAFAFLKWSLLDDPDPCYELLNHVSSYSYKYIKPKLNSSFKEAVFIKYQNTSFIAYLHENLQTEPKETTIVVLGDTIKKYKFTMVYVIALKLFNLISAGLFDTQLGNVSLDRVTNMNSSLISEIQKEYKGPTIQYFNNRWHSQDIKNLVLDEDNTFNLKPFFYVPDLEVFSNLIQGHLPNNLSFESEISTIMVGSLKYFTAPFLQCKQVGVIRESVECKSLLGIKFKWWLTNTNIQDLMNHNLDKLKDFKLIESIDKDTLIYDDFQGYFQRNQVLTVLDIKGIPQITQTKIKEDVSETLDMSFAMEDMGLDDFDMMNEMELDFGDELLGDEELIREDTAKYEDTSGSSDSADKNYIDYRKLDEYTNTTPYFIQETNVTFNLNKPRSIEYLEKGKEKISELIYMSSKSIDYLFRIKPFHKLIILITFLNSYNKWCSTKDESYKKRNIVQIILLTELTNEIIKSIESFQLDYISNDYVIVQQIKKLSLCFYIDDPDDEDIRNIEVKNGYFLKDSMLIQNNKVIKKDITLGENYYQGLIVVGEEHIMNFMIQFNLVEALGFIHEKWKRQYSLIETSQKESKKKKLYEILESLD